MPAAETDVAIVGAGYSGLLVARELLRAGRRVTVIERGGHKPHPLQLADERHDLDLPTTRHNHETADGSPPYPWNYVYGVGGSSLHWTGAAPRLLPSDFELRSRHGVGRDWPIGYDDLRPYFEEAERALQVAGTPDPRFPRDGAYPHPPHPLSPADELVRPHLGPFGALPQARPTRAINGRGRCLGNTNCALCPIDNRHSALHLLDDERLLEAPGLELRDRTAVARLRVDGGRVRALELVGAERERSVLEARTVVLAAGGLENPAVLLRSGLDGPAVGRYLADHGHRQIHVELDRPALGGRGAAHITGISYAWMEGDWRGARGSQILMPLNQGLLLSAPIEEGLLAGLRGRRLREATGRAFERRLVFDSLGEDLPDPDRRVTLSSRRDALGLPRTSLRFGADSPYLERSRRVLYRELEERLAPLGGRVVDVRPVGEGSHQLGTCHMGEGGVVDADLRHLEIENLRITGGSAFPTSSSLHPTVTIAALAVRLGRALAGAAA